MWTESTSSVDEKISPVKDTVRFRLLFGCSDSSENTDGRTTSQGDTERVSHDTSLTAADNDTSKNTTCAEYSVTDSDISDDVSLHSCSEEVNFNNNEVGAEAAKDNGECCLNICLDRDANLVRGCDNAPDNEIPYFRCEAPSCDTTPYVTSELSSVQQHVNQHLKTQRLVNNLRDNHQCDINPVQKFKQELNTCDAAEQGITTQVPQGLVKSQPLNGMFISNSNMVENIGLTVLSVKNSQSMVAVNSSSVKVSSVDENNSIDITLPRSQSGVILVDSQEPDCSKCTDDSNVIVIDDDDENVNTYGFTVCLQSTRNSYDSRPHSFTVNNDCRSPADTMLLLVSSCSQNSDATTVDVGNSPQKFVCSLKEEEGSPILIDLPNKSSAIDDLPIQLKPTSSRHELVIDYVQERCVVNCLSTKPRTKNEVCLHDTKIEESTHFNKGEGSKQSTVSEISALASSGEKFKHFSYGHESKVSRHERKIIDGTLESSSIRSNPHEQCISKSVPSHYSPCRIHSSSSTVSFIDPSSSPTLNGSACNVDNNSDSLFSDSSQ